MKKKLFLIALAAFLTLGLAACEDDNGGNDEYETNVESETAEGYQPPVLLESGYGIHLVLALFG